jgi:hypothetical protein
LDDSAILNEARRKGSVIALAIARKFPDRENYLLSIDKEFLVFIQMSLVSNVSQALSVVDDENVDLLIAIAEQAENIFDLDNCHLILNSWNFLKSSSSNKLIKNHNIEIAYKKCNACLMTKMSGFCRRISNS